MLVSIAATVHSADELLPVAQQLIDRSSSKLIADPAADISCRAGCSACCSQAVPVTHAEVRAVRAAIDALEPTQRAEIDTRVTETVAALNAAGVDTAQFVDAGADPSKRRAAARKYFAANVPCPLLSDDGVCTIRDHRPLACREYLVSSDPTYCASIDQQQSNTQVVRIRAKNDVIAGFGQVATEFGEEYKTVLAFALAQPSRPAPEASARSGPLLAQLLHQPVQSVHA